MGPACHTLCTIKVSFLGFWLLIFGHLPFSFNLMPTLKGTIKVSFLGLFLAPDIWSLAFFFRSHAVFETFRPLLQHGTLCHPLCTMKVSFHGLFFAPDIWSLSFFFRSHAASAL
jgi:hypothetical protein